MYVLPALQSFSAVIILKSIEEKIERLHVKVVHKMVIVGAQFIFI